MYKRQELGFRVLEEVSSDDKWYGSTLALQDGSDEPMIWIWRQGDEDNSVVCNHFVFSTNGKMDEVYENIVAAGIECNPPFTAAWGGRELIPVSYTHLGYVRLLERQNLLLGQVGR